MSKQDGGAACVCGKQLSVSYSFDLQRARLECDCGYRGPEISTSQIWRRDGNSHAVENALIAARNSDRGEKK